MTVCPKGLITTSGHPVMGLPEYSRGCIGCRKCVAICPGLAVTLVDRRKDADHPTVPFHGNWGSGPPRREPM